MPPVSVTNLKRPSDVRSSRVTPHLELMQRQHRRVQTFYDQLGADRDRWIARSRYYYDALQRLLQFIVPPGRRVLDIGCGNGDLLAGLRPSLGVGIDLSEGMLSLARSKHPELELYDQPAEQLSLGDHEVRDGEGGF